MHAWHQMAPISSRRWLLLALAGTALIASSVTAPGPALAAGQPRLAVPGSRPAWATPTADTGPVPAGTVIDARVYLTGRDPAGLPAYAQQVSEPGSPEYEHYLTPTQYQQRFGPTAAQVSSVRQWLTGAGMDVTAVTDHYVAVRGTEAAASTAFGTSLHAYRVAGASERAPEEQVSVPAEVAPAILAITGLSTSSEQQMTPDITGTAGQAEPVVPCGAYWGQNAASNLPPAYGHTLDYDVCDYTPAQVRAAYGVSHSGLTGRGVRIAIVDPGASPTMVSDVNTYAQQEGGQPLRPGQLTQDLPSDIAQSCPSTSAVVQGYYREESEDVEGAHVMAPNADIVYLGTDCPTTGAIPDATVMLDAETQIVDGHLASIVCNTWPLGTESQMAPGIVAAYQQVFEQGAVEGIGFYSSSGDQGDWSPFTPDNQTAVQFPASDPWVTSVGGTSLAIGPHDNYEWETGWGSDVSLLSSDGTSWGDLPGRFGGGSGGGPSSLFTQPFYQRGVVPASLSEPAGAAAPMRVMPDIAADADPGTSMAIGVTTLVNGTPEYIVDQGAGTSLATALIIGIQADAQQARHGVPIGFANPAIYARYGTAAYHDVTDYPLGPGITVAAVDPQPGAAGTIYYGVVTFGHDTSLHATIGYDDVTGVGTPTARYLDSYRIP